LKTKSATLDEKAPPEENDGVTFIELISFPKTNIFTGSGSFHPSVKNRVTSKKRGKPSPQTTEILSADHHQIHDTLVNTVAESEHEALCSGGCAQFATALHRTFGGKIILAWRRERGDTWTTLSHCAVAINGTVYDHTGMHADITWEERFEDCDAISLWKWQEISRITTLKRHCRRFGIPLREREIQRWVTKLKNSHLKQNPLSLKS
jgi:hypothetical protein